MAAPFFLLAAAMGWGLLVGLVLGAMLMRQWRLRREWRRWERRRELGLRIAQRALDEQCAQLHGRERGAEVRDQRAEVR